MSFFKYTITAPLTLYLVYKRKYKVIEISVAMHMVLTVVSALWLGENLNSFISNKTIYQILVVFLGLILLHIIFRAERMDQKTDMVILSLLTIFSLVFVYHRNYDFFVMVIPLAYWAKELITNVKAKKYGSAFINVLFLGVIWIMFFNP